MTSEKVDYGDKDLVVRSIKALDGGLDSSTFNGIQTKILQNESSIASVSAAFGTQLAQVTGDIELAKINLVISTSSITRSRLGTLSPDDLNVSASRQDGSAYSGRFVIDISHDGTAYGNDYESLSDEATYSYEVPSTIDVLGTDYFVASVKVKLYASGGTDLLLEEKMCAVSLDSSASAIYFGAIETEPGTGMLPGDYYWDDNDVGIGNAGTPMVYTGTAWTEYLSSMPGYQNAMVTMLPDMGAWATEQGETVAAASAIFTKLVTADAFIANLFTQFITVGSGGRIRYETGSGVQKRTVQLADEKIDWLDTPDTSPASPEQLQARIGRLGVGGAVLLDGEFSAGIDSSWSTEVSVNAASSGHPSAIETSLGELRLAYRRNSDGYLVERIWSGSAWGSESVINAADSAFVAYTEFIDGELRIAYRRTSDGYLVERIWSGSAWGSESVINAANSYYATSVVLDDGTVWIVYQRPADGTFVRRIWSGSAWGSESVIGVGGANTPSLIESGENEIRFAYKGSPSTYLVEKIFDGSSWSAESTINAAALSSSKLIKCIDGTVVIVYSSGGVLYQRTLGTSSWGSQVTIGGSSVETSCGTQRKSGELRFIYTLSGTNYLVERTLQRYARIGAGIIESGSNANGSYIKYGDGTMVQWYFKATAFAVPAGGSEAFYNYPVPFVGQLPAFSGGAGPATSWAGVSITAVSYDTLSRGLIHINTTSAQNFLNLSWHAIGRWK